MSLINPMFEGEFEIGESENKLVLPQPVLIEKNKNYTILSMIKPINKLIAQKVWTYSFIN